jgi:predicted RNA binding protein YcfA (HicA-like mRNA interferase family)
VAQRLRPISGRDAVKILCNRFGFRVVRQRGSHVVLRKDTPTGAIGTVVPAHGELALPTLRNALEMARIPAEEFAKHQ